MAESDQRARADERFQAALTERGARDPRDFYRDRLKEMREAAPEAYQKARRYYETRLIPAVAAEGSDPLREWLEYGRLLATLTASGRTVQIDASGLSSDYAPPVSPDHLVLHLPEQTSRPALVVGIPMKLSPAQRAAYDLLVKQSLGG